MKKVNCLTASFSELKHALCNNVPIEGIKMIVTHPCPHIDEIASVLVLKETEEGATMFPGIKNAPIGFLTATQLRTSGFYGFDGSIRALQQGYLLIGVGEGFFDEHGKRERSKSCFDLVTYFLQMFGKKENRTLRQKHNMTLYNELRVYVNFEDANSDNIVAALKKASPDHLPTKEQLDAVQSLQPGSIACNLKKGFELAGNDLVLQQEVFEDGIRFLRRHINWNRRHLEYLYEVDTLTKDYFYFKNSNHQCAVLVTHDGMGFASAFKKKVRVHKNHKVVAHIVAKSNGQFAILTSLSKEIMHEVCVNLRKKLFYKKTGEKLFHKNAQGFGVCSQVPELFICELTGTIINGSKIDPDAQGVFGLFLDKTDIFHALQDAIIH